MVASTFLVEQYKTLREEIKDCKTRIFRIMTVGIVIPPALNVVSKELDKLSDIVLATPLIVFAFGVLLVSENRSIMRCACYIRLHVEPKAMELEPELVGLICWENWLESDDDEFPKRYADITSSIGFLCLFIIYYISSSYIAYKFAASQYPEINHFLVIGIYVAFGVGFLIMIVSNRGLIRGTAHEK